MPEIFANGQQIGHIESIAPSSNRPTQPIRHLNFPLPRAEDYLPGNYRAGAMALDLSLSFEQWTELLKTGLVSTSDAIKTLCYLPEFSMEMLPADETATILKPNNKYNFIRKAICPQNPAKPI